MAFLQFRHRKCFRGLLCVTLLVIVGSSYLFAEPLPQVRAMAQDQQVQAQVPVAAPAAAPVIYVQPGIRVEPSAPAEDALDVVERQAQQKKRQAQNNVQVQTSALVPSKLTKLMQSFPSDLAIPLAFIGFLHGLVNNWLSAGGTNHNFWWVPWTESTTHLLFLWLTSGITWGKCSILGAQDAHTWAWINLCYGCAQMLGESMPRVPYTIIPSFSLTGSWRNIAFNRSLAMVPLHMLRA